MARLLYLKSYSRIDSIDHLIKQCRVAYRSWKYWHSPANHAKALAIATAYDMYLELAEGKVLPSMKISHPIDFFYFATGCLAKCISMVLENSSTKKMTV